MVRDIWTQVDYYRDEHVRRRLAEYCGGDPDDPETFLCEYLVGYGEAFVWEKRPAPFLSVKNEQFDFLLEKGLDIFRSVWSKNVTLGILDVEYFNLDYKGEIYLHQREAFERMEPVYQIISAIYQKYGINFQTIMTGQGYHFTSLVPFNGEIHKNLVAIGHLEESLEGKYKYVPPFSRRTKTVPLEAGLAYDGIGKLLEFICHEIIREAGSQNLDIPVVISDIATGNQGRGREGVSLDLTMFSDPLFMRDIRLPFSTHQKHRVMRDKVGEHIARGTPIQISLPREDKSLDELFEIRRHYGKAAEYAAEVTTLIPDASEGWKNVYERYKGSALAEFHTKFDAVHHDHWTSWHTTYDRTTLSTMPVCVQHAIYHPNPELLKPTNLQTLCRTFLGMGWHPKHIAGFIRSKYERDFQWGENWGKYDAPSRANWWCRTYCGLIYGGIDKGVDHNCVSHQDKGFCVKPWCGFNLADYWPRTLPEL